MLISLGRKWTLASVRKLVEDVPVERKLIKLKAVQLEDFKQDELPG